MEENVLNKLNDLIETIKSSNDYKRYVIVSKTLYSNKKLMDKIKRIKTLQKEIIKLQSTGNDYSKEDIEINSILEELNKYPVYVEYEELVEKLNYEYNYIKKSIELYIDNLIK